MKKIGIITIHNSPNYGACLQAFALYEYIRKSGNDVEIIDLHRPHYDDFIPSKKYMAYRPDATSRNIKQKIKKILGISRKPVFYNNDAKQKFDKFNEQIKMGRAYRGVDELYSDPPVYDLYITGSDQLWNPSQPYCLEPYFLTFTPDDSIRISYAASIGVTELTPEEKADFKKWLMRYDAVSVREAQAKELLESFVPIQVQQVSDPTFLLSQEEWKSTACYPGIREPYILLFTLQYNKKLLDYAKRLGSESGYKVISLGQVQPDATDNSYSTVKDAGPCEFLGYIAGAKMVITDSFHCSVFSLIMGADNFYSYIAPDNNRGSRIKNLLQTYHLSDHLLNTDLKTTYSDLQEKTVDKESVSLVIKREQQLSRSFLNRYIGHAE